MESQHLAFIRAVVGNHLHRIEEDYNVTKNLDTDTSLIKLFKCRIIDIVMENVTTAGKYE